jgi:hypothetical protein
MLQEYGPTSPGTDIPTGWEALVGFGAHNRSVNISAIAIATSTSTGPIATAASNAMLSKRRPMPC